MNLKKRSAEHRGIKKVYILTLFVLGLSGFAQMPIFKRYYIADIPGLGWLADFYFTHYLHYIAAMVLFCIFGYCITAYFLADRHAFRLTRVAYVRMFFLSGLVITGIFRVLKNLPDVVFSYHFNIVIDIAHIIFMMLFLSAAFVFLMMKTGWLKSAA
ncbi:MAG: FeS-binding protein [Desulfococcaceae bacterium]